MNNYFNINYEFDKNEVHRIISESLKGYICVADGVVLTTANNNKEYLSVVNNSLCSICDSSWVPLYLKSIYGVSYDQYCGADIFKDIVSSRKYRMMFLGTDQPTLDALRKELTVLNPEVVNMKFVELPFCDVEKFDYPKIAKMIEEDGPKVIWVALGAPKQELFMNRLVEHIQSGIMLGVGAVFKFYSGKNEKRCPSWIQKSHLEFLYRIFQDPRKQLKRCWGIVCNLPRLYFEELKKNRK